MREKLRLKDKITSAWSGFRDLAHLTRYQELYIEADENYPVPLKRNYRDGKLIGTAALAYPLYPPCYLEDRFVPSFAEGRCLIIGEGAYKIVVVDHNGQSDKVIKLAYGIYKGESAELKAQTAVSKLRQIYDIANEMYPGIALPADWIIEERGGIYEVYEVQQRALVHPIDLFDPRTSERLDRQATKIAIDGTKRLKTELLCRGLARVDNFFWMGDITDGLSLTEIHFDSITNRLVSLDIVDRLDIEPLLPPNLKQSN